MAEKYIGYENLKNKKQDKVELISFYFGEAFKSVERKINRTVSIKEPWTITVKEKVHYSIFMAWCNAFKLQKGSYGRDYVIKYGKEDVVKSVNIRFTHRGSLVFHMAKALNCSDTEMIIDKCFCKTMKNKCVGSIVVDEENPLFLNFNASKHTLTIKCKYVVTNSFGITVSH